MSFTNLHRDPSIWGADANEFRPERWEEAPGGLESVLPKCAYMPFGMGGRMCLGMRLALLQARAVVAVLLTRLDWAPAPQSPRSFRRQLAARVRRLLGREEDKKEEGRVERLRISYPSTAVFPDGVTLSVKERRG